MMNPHELRAEFEQFIPRLESGAMNGHIREVAGWLAVHTSSIAFDERFHTEQMEGGGARYRERPPQTTLEQLRESDIHDASTVLSAAAKGQILPNAGARIRAVLQYLPSTPDPARVVNSTATPSPPSVAIPPDVVRRLIYLYRILSQQTALARTLVDFLHRLGEVRPIVQRLAAACAARDIDPAPFARLVTADGEALWPEHISRHADTRPDVMFTVADAQLPLLRQAVADEERAAGVPDDAVARLVDEVTQEVLPGLNPAAWFDRAGGRGLHATQADRLIEIAENLALAARQRGMNVDAFARLVQAVTSPPLPPGDPDAGPGDVGAAFEALTTLRATPLPPPLVPPPTPPSPLTRDSALPRLQVDQDNSVIALDGHRYPVTPNQARAVQRLLDAKGGWLPSKSMKEFANSGERPGRWIRRLPQPVRDIIEGKTGSGFRLKIPLA